MNQIEDDEGFAPDGGDVYTIVTEDGGAEDQDGLEARAKELGFSGSQAKKKTKSNKMSFKI